MKFTTILVAFSTVFSGVALASPVEAESAAALATNTVGGICPALLTMIAASSEQDAFFYASPQAAVATDLRQHESPENSCQ
ncbi:hypothetical protein V491_00746 [Pseudogymnoascus sp. VKM F-3775]|nr:hypothetical protein V491_00746 [Pseudogymnoascus sp. VKM F-3775]